jgi:hypothetical protein
LKFGTDLASAAIKVGVKPADATTVHPRPALIQEISWPPRSFGPADSAKPDPVREGVLYFVNDALYRIVVTYDRYKIEGLTPEDIIEGISAHYGPATTPTAQIEYHTNYDEVAAVIARWEDAEYSYNIVRTGDKASFALILYSKRLEAVARAAIAEAARLDVLEAPQRELAKEKSRQEEERLALEKARSVNKPNFRP